MDTKHEVIALAAVLIVGIAGVFMIMGGNGDNLPSSFEKIEKSTFKQDLVGEAYTPSFQEIREGTTRNCLCKDPRRGSESQIVDASWDPAITARDVWNPPLVTGATGCFYAWVVARCQQDAGFLNAYSVETWPAE